MWSAVVASAVERQGQPIAVKRRLIREKVQTAIHWNMNRPYSSVSRPDQPKHVAKLKLETCGRRRLDEKLTKRVIWS